VRNVWEDDASRLYDASSLYDGWKIDTVAKLDDGVVEDYEALMCVSHVHPLSIE
jgi:hypothetical protein